MTVDPLDQFVLDVEVYSPGQASIMRAVRNIYRVVEPNISEKIIYGGIGFFFNDTHVGGVYGNKAHVNIVFSKGYKLSDPDMVLEGKGQFRRHIRAITEADVITKNVEDFIKQVVRLEMGSNEQSE